MPRLYRRAVRGRGAAGGNRTGLWLHRAADRRLIPGVSVRTSRQPEVSHRRHLMLATGLLFSLAGCGPAGTSPAPPSPSAALGHSPFPPRPAELRIDGIDPCTLLTAPQRTALMVNYVRHGEDTDELHSPACLWDNSGGK